MGGWGARSEIQSLRVYTMEKYASLELDDHIVDAILDQAVENGSIVYVKPRDSKNMENDLFAHAALYLAGWRFTVHRESEGHKNIDFIKRNGEYWEVKSPTADGTSKDPTKFVQERLREARHQYRSHPHADEAHVRVVFNTKHTLVPDDVIEARLRSEAERQGIESVVMVNKRGELITIR